MTGTGGAPRTRSPFAAAFLALLFPGLGHAYGGAWGRALAFAALPLLSLALLAGIVVRAEPVELLGFVVQRPVLQAILVLDVVILVYRVIAVVDAWQVARYLDEVEAAGGAPLGPPRTRATPLSVAGLAAVLLVLAGGHVAVARYDVLALSLVDCVFADDGDAACLPGEDDPLASRSPDPAASDEPLPSPLAPPSGAPPAASLPPWDGEGRLNVLLIGADQRPGEGSFNTDTLIVVSADPATGRVALFQVPRDMVDVPVPEQARPVWGSLYRGKINSWYMQNRNREDLWPGSTAQARGMAALKAILGELYGLEIHHYVMVNFDGFVQVVDTLGGVLVNVQIPVAESTYPTGVGARLTRLHIPAGPQQMTGTEALQYARSRHRAAGGDFDRGRRQQRLLVSLRDQMDARAIVANLPSLVDALKSAVRTDIRTTDLPRFLALAERVDTRNIRSFVFAPPYFATEYLNSPRGYVIVANVARIRRSAQAAFDLTAEELARVERIRDEGARAWVRNGSGRNGLAAAAAGYLSYGGLDASAPTQRVPAAATTTIVVRGGAERRLPATIAWLEELFGVAVTLSPEPSTGPEIVITLGRDAPDLVAPDVG